MTTTSSYNLRDALEKLIDDAGDQFSIPQLVPVRVVSVAALKQALAPRCAHCGDRIKQFDDDVQWTSLEDFGGTGTGALAEKLWCVEAPGHDHSPASAYWESERHSDELHWSELTQAEPDEASAYRDHARLHLEAAAPLLSPRPLLDRDVLVKAIAAEFDDYPEGLSFLTALDGGILPTSQVATLAADAVVALINGSAS